jgi:2-oxoglutarate dehydrogenase E2 component (dihydrolipoamide succinyltransferase)
MATQLTAPRMGEGVEELTLVKWLKEEGDPVRENESILEVETDKVVTELPSPASGVVLKRLVEEGLPVKVGDLLAWIGEPGEAIPASTKHQGNSVAETRHAESLQDSLKEEKLPREPVSQENPAPISKKQASDSFLSPLVKRMLADNNLESSQVVGTGQNGRITKQDVQAYLEKQGLQTSVGAQPPMETGGRRSAPLPETSKIQEPTATIERALPGLHPLSNIRRTIAQRMMESLNTSAHVLTVMEADLSRVEAHRKLNKPLFAQDGVRLTLTAYFVAAISAALKANPKVNSSWTEEELLIHPEINIGMAVSLGEEGLIVPVIQNADTLSLLGIARQVNDLAERARTKKLKPKEVRGGTFSLTNHGMSGSLFASPIITQPQVGILGTGLVQKRAVVLTDEQGNDSIAIRPMVYLSFVFDHRVLDGEGADNFLRKVKETLEEWV